MAFPTSPTDGQTYSNNGQDWIYSQTNKTWTKKISGGGGGGNLATMLAEENIQSGDIVRFGTTGIRKLTKTITGTGNNMSLNDTGNYTLVNPTQKVSSTHFCMLDSTTVVGVGLLNPNDGSTSGTVATIVGKVTGSSITFGLWHTSTAPDIAPNYKPVYIMPIQGKQEVLICYWSGHPGMDTTNTSTYTIKVIHHVVNPSALRVMPTTRATYSISPVGYLHHVSVTLINPTQVAFAMAHQSGSSNYSNLRTLDLATMTQAGATKDMAAIITPFSNWMNTMVTGFVTNETNTGLFFTKGGSSYYWARLTWDGANWSHHATMGQTGFGTNPGTLCTIPSETPGKYLYAFGHGAGFEIGILTSSSANGVTRTGANFTGSNYPVVVLNNTSFHTTDMVRISNGLLLVTFTSDRSSPNQFAVALRYDLASAGITNFDGTSKSLADAHVITPAAFKGYIFCRPTKSIFIGQSLITNGNGGAWWLRPAAEYPSGGGPAAPLCYHSFNRTGNVTLVDYENALGIAQENIASGSQGKVVTLGGISTVHTGLVPGTQYYIDGATGALSGTGAALFGRAVSPTSLVIASNFSIVPKEQSPQLATSLMSGGETNLVLEQDTLTQKYQGRTVMAISEQKTQFSSDTLGLGKLRTIPAANHPGRAGDFCADDKNLYICTAQDTWKSLPIGNFNVGPQPDIPFMTTAQRQALPKAKMFVYDTDLGFLCMCDGTNWQRVGIGMPMVLPVSSPGFLYSGSLTSYVSGQPCDGMVLPSAGDMDTLKNYIVSMYAVDGANTNNFGVWLLDTSVPGNVGNPFGFGLNIKSYVSETSAGFGTDTQIMRLMGTSNTCLNIPYLLGAGTYSSWNHGGKGAWPVRALWIGDPTAKTCTDAGGNVYDILTIGTQKWLAQDYKGTTWHVGSSKTQLQKKLPPANYAATGALQPHYTTSTNT